MNYGDKHFNFTVNNFVISCILFSIVSVSFQVIVTYHDFINKGSIYTQVNVVSKCVQVTLILLILSVPYTGPTIDLPPFVKSKLEV